MRPTSFVLFAEMRTGSNFLEANLNALPGVTCHGELFNPHFVGRLECDAAFGMTLAERDADPLRFLARMRAATPGLAGFRYFHDHDPRVFPAVMDDPACAKIVLTRNPLDSYLSLKIARATGQWKLTDPRRLRRATVRFEAAEFAAHVEALQAFQIALLRALQRRGQTAFWLDYDDIGDIEVLNGLAAFLGVAGRLEAVDPALKRQNPEPPAERVENAAEMAEALARFDTFGLGRTPNFEPRRPPAVPSFLAAGPLLFMPLRGGPEAEVAAWLAAVGPLAGGFTQRTLRQWMRAHPGFRSFAVVRHPRARAAAVFAGGFLAGEMPDLRAGFQRTMGIRLPPPGEPVPAAAARDAFLAFLRFARMVLNGQTAHRVPAALASQVALLQGFAQLQPPDHVIREDRLAAGLSFLAAETGIAAPPPPPPAAAPPPLARAGDGEIDAALRDAYGRDLVAFGYG